MSAPAAVDLFDGFFDAGAMFLEHCKRFLEGHQFALGLGRIFPGQPLRFHLGNLFGDGALSFRNVSVRFALPPQIVVALDRLSDLRAGCSFVLN
jgi:hypothetical protein